MKWFQFLSPSSQQVLSGKYQQSEQILDEKVPCLRPWPHWKACISVTGLPWLSLPWFLRRALFSLPRMVQSAALQKLLDKKMMTGLRQLLRAEMQSTSSLASRADYRNGPHLHKDVRNADNVIGGEACNEDDQDYEGLGNGSHAGPLVQLLSFR